VAVKSYGKHHPYCRRRDICPWCYGREVSAFYALVQRVLRPDDALVAVTDADFDTAELSYDQFRQRLDWCRLIMRGLVRANEVRSTRAHEACRAARWSIVVDPPSSHPAQAQNQQPALCIRCRLLMIMHAEEPAVLIPTLPGWQTNRVNNPDEEMCQRLVAKVCDYPTGLLYGTPEARQMALECENGHAFDGNCRRFARAAARDF
jgi:hypothetical protein